MPYPFKNQFIATNPKSQHLDIPDFIIGRQNTGQSYIDFFISPKYPKFLPCVTITLFLTNALVKMNNFNSFFAKQFYLLETDREERAEYLLTQSIRISKS